MLRGIWLPATGLGVLLLVTLVSGCEKKEAAAPSTPVAEPAGHGAAAPASAPSTSGISQKKCPVCGGEAIDPTVFVEYKGKKVYFCCSHCKEPFEKNPDKYAASIEP
jgi:YHS domain-containing protein